MSNAEFVKTKNNRSSEVSRLLEVMLDVVWEWPVKRGHLSIAGAPHTRVLEDRMCISAVVS